ncbi:hypothetical protein DIPPA_09298 [Diplonema papillatum]|nr:hypothetical protein DIPPA_09298 [Diplonema papillatum]
MGLCCSRMGESPKASQQAYLATMPVKTLEPDAGFDSIQGQRCRNTPSRGKPLYKKKAPPPMRNIPSNFKSKNGMS